MSSATDTAVIESYSEPGEIEALVSAFEACTLPREEWTHRAHLTVALWYLLHHDAAEATPLIRAGIQRFNRARGIMTTRTGGYHETITLFYIRVIDKYLSGARTETTLINLFNNLFEKYGDRRLPLEYYSRERLMSSEARLRWVEPDLRPLD